MKENGRSEGGGKWKHWPPKKVYEPQVLNWFADFQNALNEVLPDSQRQYYSSSNKPLKGVEAKQKLDLLLSDHPPDDKGAHQWSNVLVIGEHKTSSLYNQKELGEQLAFCVREVFGSQPTRRFLHTFTISGSKLRLWGLTDQVFTTLTRQSMSTKTQRNFSRFLLDMQ